MRFFNLNKNFIKLQYIILKKCKTKIKRFIIYDLICVTTGK